MNDFTPTRNKDAARHFTVLDGMDDRTVADLISREHPQTIALVISKLNDRARAILNALPAPLGSEVSRRIDAIQPVHPGVVEEVERILTREIETREHALAAGEFANGMGVLPDRADEDGQNLHSGLLRNIEDASPELAKALRSRLRKD